MSEVDEKELEGPEDPLEDEEVEVDGEDDLEEQENKAKEQLIADSDRAEDNKLEDAKSPITNPTSPSEVAKTPPPAPNSSGTIFNADVNNSHKCMHIFNDNTSKFMEEIRVKTEVVLVLCNLLRMTPIGVVIVVSIAVFQVVDPGLIPGLRNVDQIMQEHFIHISLCFQQSPGSVSR